MQACFQLRKKTSSKNIQTKNKAKQKKKANKKASK